MATTRERANDREPPVADAVHWIITLAGEPVCWSDDAKTYWNTYGDHWAWRDGDWLYQFGGKPIGWVSGDTVHDAHTGNRVFSLRPAATSPTDHRFD